MISVQGCNCQLRFYLVDLRSLSIFALICSGQSIGYSKGMIDDAICLIYANITPVSPSRIQVEAFHQLSLILH